MAAIPSPSCQATKKNGSPCAHSVRPGEVVCWQHAKSLKSRLRSLTRNQELAFGLIILGLIGTFVGAGLAVKAELDSRSRKISLAELASQLAPDKSETERAAGVVALSVLGKDAIPYLKQAALDANPKVYRAAFGSLGRMGEVGFVAVLELLNEKDWIARLLLHSDDSTARFSYSRERLDPPELPRLTAAMGALYAASSQGRLTSSYQPLITGRLYFIMSVTRGLDTTELDNQIFSIAMDADNPRPTYFETVRWRWLRPPRHSEYRYLETRVEEPSTIRRLVYASTGLWRGNIEQSTGAAVADPFGDAVLPLLSAELKSLKEIGNESDAKDALDIELHTMQRVSKIAQFIRVLKEATRQNDISWSDRAAETLIEDMYFIPDDRFVSKGKEAKMSLSEEFVYSLHEGSWEPNLSLTKDSRRLWTEYVRELHYTFLALHSEKLTSLLLSTIAESPDTEATVFSCYHLSEGANTVMLGKLWESETIYAALARNLKLGNPEMRYASVRALALSPRSEARTLLRSSLNEEDDPVVRSAILKSLRK